MFYEDWTIDKSEVLFYRNLCIESWGHPGAKASNMVIQKKTEHVLTFDQARITQMILLGWEPIFGKFIGMSRMILYGSAVMVWTHYCIYTIVWFKCPKPLGPLDGLLDWGRVWPCLACFLCWSGVLWGRENKDVHFHPSTCGSILTAI